MGSPLLKHGSNESNSQVPAYWVEPRNSKRRSRFEAEAIGGSSSRRVVIVLEIERRVNK